MTRYTDKADLLVQNMDSRYVKKTETLGTFAELKALIGTGGTVTLNKDYKNTDNKTEITSLSSDLIIDGQGHSLDGNNYARFINIASDTGVNIILKNLILKNFSASSNGGAIRSYVPVIIINCTFENNSAEGDGGAIVNNNHLKIVDSKFINNKAISSNKTGGAIRAYSNTYIANSLFEGNSCYTTGGSLYLDGRENYRLINNVFINNSALTQNGGAVFQGKSYNCTFIDNTANQGVGGAVRSGDAYNSIFINNYALNGGGAIHVSNNNYEAVNCSFITSTDTTDGIPIKNYVTTT